MYNSILRLRLSDQLREALRTAAKQRATTESDLVRVALMNALGVDDVATRATFTRGELAATAENTSSVISRQLAHKPQRVRRAL